MPNAQLIPASQGQLETLRNLLQLYLYDFSEYLDENPDERGLFDPGFDLRRYWEQPGFWPYLARAGRNLVGFVLICDRTHHRQGPGRYVDEFFVLRRFRRQGFGRSLAYQLFDTFRGYWEVNQVGPNKPAQIFWRTVIGEYTQGRFREFTTDEGSMQVVWQVFNSHTWEIP